MIKKWKILSKLKMENGRWKTDDIVSYLLANRGLKTKKEVDDFFSPILDKVTLSRIGISNLQIKKAIKRIQRAIETGQSIIIYTDYDADGICAGAILWETLYSLGAKVMPHVPHRIDEGYGLSKKGIDHVKQKFGADLIITVDHGINAFDKVSYAKSQGIDVIITDHHLPGKRLPNAVAIVHTTSLSGTAIAWLLAREMQSMASTMQNEELRHSFYRQLELVALATIADLVPLVGPNRTLTKFGLEKLNQTDRIGLLALIKEAGVTLGSIGTYQVGHMLVPRINALGRLTHALNALRLLCTKSEARAQKLASQLSATNRDRQQLTEKMYLHAKECYRDDKESKIIFIHHQSFNEGVIGLVASKLVEEYYRPAVVVAQRGEYSKASARSIDGFNIVEAIRSCSDLLIDCGGHPMAAGFTIETIKLGQLKRRLYDYVAKSLPEKILIPELKIDCELPLESVTWQLMKMLKPFEPYGVTNPRPIFVSKRVHLLKARTVGVDGSHLKLLLAKRGDLDVIGFGIGDLYSKLSPDIPIDLAYTVDENSWNGQRKLQLTLKDIKIPSIYGANAY